MEFANVFTLQLYSYSTSHTIRNLCEQVQQCSIMRFIETRQTTLRDCAIPHTVHTYMASCLMQEVPHRAILLDLHCLAKSPLVWFIA